MINYTLHLTKNQIDLLFWVEAGCLRETQQQIATFNSMQFVRNVNKLIHSGYVVNQHPKEPAYLLTEKGEILAWFLRLELRSEEK